MRGESLRESVVVFNGDVLTEVDLAAVIALHRERKAKATIVLTPVDNPTAYGLVETDAAGNIQRFLEKPNADEITCDTINAGIYVLEPDTFDRIPKDTPWSIERSFFPSLIERGETFVAYVYRGYWIDIGTPEKYMQVHRDIMDRPLPRGAVSPAVRARRVGVARARASKKARSSRAPASSTPAPSSRPAPASGPTASSAATATSKSTRRSTARSSGPTPASARKPSSAARFSAATATSGRSAIVEDGVVLGDKSVVTDYSRSVCSPSLPLNCLNPDIFKAYDIRGVYPGEVNEEAARAIGAAFVAYLGARGSPSAATCGCRRRRWPRRSSTAPPRRAPTSSTTA